jgi:hypothetical protein
LLTPLCLCSSYWCPGQQIVWCSWALYHRPLPTNHCPRVTKLPQCQDPSHTPDPTAQRFKPDVTVLPSGERRTNTRCQGEVFLLSWESWALHCFLVLCFSLCLVWANKVPAPLHAYL